MGKKHIQAHYMLPSVDHYLWENFRATLPSLGILQFIGMVQNFQAQRLHHLQQRHMLFLSVVIVKTICTKILNCLLAVDYRWKTQHFKMINGHVPQCCTSFSSVPYQSSFDRECSNVHISIEEPIFSCRNDTFRIWRGTSTGIFTPFDETLCAWNLWSVEKVFK